MKNYLVLALTITALIVWATDSRAQAPPPSLPRHSPESQGVDPQAVLAFLKAADSQVNTMHSFMLLRNGNVVAEAWWAPESADKPHVLWSLSKSFTSTAVGMAIAEGKMNLDDLVLPYFQDEAPAEPSQNLRRMRVRDLLRMATGHQSEPPRPAKESWARAFLAHPVPFKPGTHFQYNTPATFMLSAIVQKTTGAKVVDYLQTRLFDPLGIPKPRWDESPLGISLGGYGLFLRTEDIAKFGQLYLQQGRWQGKQLIPESWVREATGFRVSNGSSPDSDWEQGYGYQFWRCRHGAYRGDGKDGQFCVVLPKHNVVVVMTAKTNDLQGQLRLVWEHLLPGLHEEALPSAPGVHKEIRDFVSGLKAK